MFNIIIYKCMPAPIKYYVEACGLLSAIKFTQLPHKAIALVVWISNYPLGAIYPQGMTSIYGLGGRLAGDMMSSQTHSG